MSESTIITDHSDQAINRLLSQFEESTKLQGLISAFVDQLQEIENACFDVRDNRWIDTASGEQLDKLGTIVGAERGGRTDTDYRNLIIAAIGRNTSKGLSENLIAVFNLLTGSTASHLLEYYPAEVEIYANVDISSLNTDDIFDFCQEVLSAGVKLGHIGWYNDDEAFGFYENPDALGFGDLSDPSLGGKFASISA